MIETPVIKKHWVWGERPGARMLNDTLVRFLWDLEVKVSWFSLIWKNRPFELASKG